MPWEWLEIMGYLKAKKMILEGRKICNKLMSCMYKVEVCNLCVGNPV